MQTPLDERGLVDIGQLMEGVRSYIVPTFLWPDCPSEHHLYWLASWYTQTEKETNGEIPAGRFRELPINKIDMPRMFHTVLHHVTLPPKMPDPEIMRFQIEAWNVVSNLFVAVSKRARLMRAVGRHLTQQQLTVEREIVARKFMEERSARLFGGIAMHLEALEKIPEEHRPVDINASDDEILQSVGRVITKGCRPLGGLVAKEKRRGRRLAFTPLVPAVAS